MMAVIRPRLRKPLGIAPTTTAGHAEATPVQPAVIKRGRSVAHQVNLGKAERGSVLSGLMPPSRIK